MQGAGQRFLGRRGFRVPGQKNGVLKAGAQEFAAIILSYKIPFYFRGL
jgi:hypothetical protein